MEISPTTSQERQNPNRALTLLNVGAWAVVLGTVSGDTARETPEQPTPLVAKSLEQEPSTGTAFLPAPDSSLSELTMPATWPTADPSSSTSSSIQTPKITASEHDLQPAAADTRPLGQFTPANPIAQIADPASQDKTFTAIWWLVVTWFSIQIINGIRGLVKSKEDFAAPLRRLRNRTHFEARRDLSSPSMNSHIFEFTSGGDGQAPRFKLAHVVTKKKPKLATMIGNPEALRVFLAAAERCDEHQPFPTEKFGEAAETRLGKLRRNIFGKAAENRDPRDLQRVYLRELNKIFRDAYSELHKDGLLVKERETQIRNEILSAFEINFALSAADKAAFQKVPLVHESTHRAIWICEVTPKISRDLILADISQEHFARFGDPAKVAELLETSPKHRQRILQLQEAYKREDEYRKTRKEGDEEYLFPHVLTYTDISDKTVPAFLASLLARYDRVDLVRHLTSFAREQVERGLGDDENGEAGHAAK